MELVWWQVRRAWVATLAFQRPVWTVGSDLLNSLQVQGRRKEGRRRGRREIESPHLSSIMALSYIFIHPNISLKLLQTLFPLKCLEVMSYLFLSSPLLSRKIDLILSTTVLVSEKYKKQGRCMYIYVVQNNTKRIFAVVYCSFLNGCFMFAKTFKLLDVFPHGGFSFVLYLFM